MQSMTMINDALGEVDDDGKADDDNGKSIRTKIDEFSLCGHACKNSTSCFSHKKGEK